ncbi:hypothetical protein N8652_02880, partial [bacterium]|nr:hypothetical protein [bacterium]
RVNPPVPQPKPDLDKGLIFEGDLSATRTKIVRDRVTGPQAAIAANALGGSLANFETKEILDDFLRQFPIPVNENYFTGLRKINGDWVWGTGAPLNYTWWAPGWPQNFSEYGIIEHIPPHKYAAVASNTVLDGFIVRIEGNQSQSGWARSLGPDNSIEGAPLQRETDAFSMVVDFNVEALDSIKRLSEVTRPDGSYSTIWVNSSNEVVFRSGSDELKSIPLPATGDYRAYVTTSESNDVNLVVFSAPIGVSDPSILSSVSKQFSQPPFPVDIELGDIVLKESNVPSAGQLRDALMTGYKLYDRALTQKEIEKYDTNDEAYVPDEPAPLQHFNLNGSGVSSKNTSPAAITEMISVPDRFGVEGSALKSNGDSSGVSFIGGIPSATFSSWVRFDSDRNQPNALVLGDQSISIDDQKLRFRAGNNQFQIDSLFQQVQKTSWVHLALTVKGDGFYQVYYNGEEVLSGPGASQMASFSTNFDGAVDMISTYNEALTSAQIRSIYESQKPETDFHTITQEAFQPSIEPSQASVSSSGGSASTNLILSGNVQWTATTTAPWLDITSSTTGAGSAEIRVVASRNPTVYERTGTVLVAGQTFSVIQPGLNVDLEYEQPIFRAAGGDLTIDVATEAGAAWEVSSDVNWIIPVLPAGGSAFGSGSAFIIVAGYSDTTSSRSGILNIAGKEIVISQRGYDLSVSPQVAEVGSNAGAGEFGVTAPLTAVWEAIVTEPWITLIGGQDGQGNGTVRYSLGSNTTGAPRTGKVIVSGEEYLITQYAGIQVTVNAASDGTASGSGSYDTNEVAILTAEADPGYVFSHWTGDGVGSDNPLELIVDSVKSVTANFIPESAVTQFQQPIIAELAAKDQIIAQKDNQIQTRTITIADLQSGIDALALANVELQQSYDAAVASSRQAGRDEVILNPANYGLTTREAYNVVAAERDARPTLEEIQEARPGAILLAPNQNGMIELKIDIEETTDLEVWSYKGKSIEADFPLEPGRQFFRLSLER